MKAVSLRTLARHAVTVDVIGAVEVHCECALCGGNAVLIRQYAPDGEDPEATRRIGRALWKYVVHGECDNGSGQCPLAGGER
jgi:hypothetical protein